MAVNDVNIRLRAKDETAGAFNSVKGSLGGLKNAVFSVQGAIAGIVGGAVVGNIVQANRSFQSLQASLITFTGSAEEAAKQFDVLQNFAATTPFSLQEVVGGFNKLVARGITPSIGALTSFGNIASGTGKSLDQFIEAVADAAVGEFERLKEFGIKANVEGDKIKLTFGGVTKTISKNSQEMLAYLDQLGQTKFAGAIERQSKTLNGAFSNLGDALDKLSVSIGEAGLNDFLIDVTKNATSAAGRMGELIDRFRKFGELPSVTDVFGGRELGQEERIKDLADAVEMWQKRLQKYPNSAKILDELAKAQENLASATAKLQGTRLKEIMNEPLVQLPEVVAKPVKTDKNWDEEFKKAWEGLTDVQQANVKLMPQLDKKYQNLEARLKSTKDALGDYSKAQFEANMSGYLDPAQRGKRQQSLPAELEAIRESLVEVKSPLKDFADSMPTLNQAMENVVVGGMTALEDSLVGLVNGTMSAKDAFKSMANSIINDLIRMAIQQSITAPLAQMFGLQAAAPSVPLSPRAIGGSVQAGKPYMVGERGVEMFVPNQSGSIVSNNQLGGGGGTTIVQNINVTTGVQQTVRAEIMTLMPQIANAAKSAVADAKLRGGSYAAALR
jgi:lambda family phage tail tape measure protein